MIIPMAMKPAVEAILGVATSKSSPETLPAVPSPVVPPTPEVAALAAAISQTVQAGMTAPPHRTVLLVEDDAVTTAAMLAILELKGWKVITAKTVREGITALAVLPDIVVLDLTLPDGAGIEVFEEIRRRKLATKVIITTGCEVGDPRLIRATELDPHAVISKPISLASLFFSMEH